MYPMGRQADIKLINMITWNIRYARTNNHKLGEIAIKHGADITTLQETHQTAILTGRIRSI